MILELTAEQRRYQERVEQFAAERVAPQAAAIDERGTFPRDLVREAAALGLMGVTIPTEWGGAGLDYVSYAVAIESLAAESAAGLCFTTVSGKKCARRGDGDRVYATKPAYSKVGATSIWHRRARVPAHAATALTRIGWRRAARRGPWALVCFSALSPPKRFANR